MPAAYIPVWWRILLVVFAEFCTIPAQGWAEFGTPSGKARALFVVYIYKQQQELLKTRALRART
jgi:hypothetical protein